jgi:hypothetical protein
MRSPVGTALTIRVHRTILKEEGKTQTGSNSRKRQTSTAALAKRWATFAKIVLHTYSDLLYIYTCAAALMRAAL